MAKAKSAVKTTGKRSRKSGRAAIVTGGASGIGLACAEALLAAGWQVGILDRDQKSLDRARNPRHGNCCAGSGTGQENAAPGGQDTHNASSLIHAA